MTNLLNRFQLDRKKIFLTVLVCLTIIYLDISLFLKRQVQGIDSLKPKITKLNKDLNGLTKDLSRLQDSKNNKIEIRQRTLAKAKKIISQGEVVWLLESISGMARDNNVKIMQIKPVKESQAKEAASIQASKLAPLLIRLDLSCDYHDLGKFINELEKAETFISVEELRITAQEDTYFKQKAELGLKTYVKK